MLQSICDPGNIDRVFVRDLNPAVIVIREVRIRKIVKGVNGRSRSCGECGCRRGRVGLRGYGVKVLEEGEEKGCREVATDDRHLGDLLSDERQGHRLGPVLVATLPS